MEPTAFPISRKGDSLKRALFLCEDNYRASRFAEELFNSLIRGEGLNWQAVSRAVSPTAARRQSEPMAPEAVACLRSFGAAPVNHRRLPLGATAFDLEMSHVVIAATGPACRAAVLEAWPEHARRIEHWPVDEAAPVQDLLEDLAVSVHAMLDRMLGRRPGPRSSRPGASAKLGLRPLRGNELSHVLSRESAARLSTEPSRPG